MSVSKRDIAKIDQRRGERWARSMENRVPESGALKVPDPVMSRIAPATPLSETAGCSQSPYNRG